MPKPGPKAAPDLGDQFAFASFGLGFARRIATALGQLAFAMAQLFRQPFHHEVDGLVKIMAAIFAVEVGTRKGQVHLDDERVLSGTGGIMMNGDMCTDDIIGEMFQMADLGGHVGVDGCRELDISRTDVDLHNKRVERGGGVVDA